VIPQRIIFGVLMGAAFIGLLWVDAWVDRQGVLPGQARGAVVAGLVFVLALAASRELFRMIRAKGLRPLAIVGVIASAGLAISPFFAWMARDCCPSLSQSLPLLAVAFAVMLVFFVQAAGRRTADAIPNIAATLFAVCYLGVLGLFLVLIRVEFGIWGLLLYLVAVKFTDIGAWLAGITIGRHKMIPWLSPGKSWEGLAGGLFVAALASLAMALLGLAAHVDTIAWWKAIIFGLVLAPAGQCGDLAESLLKRDAGMKDSGATIPGFGGLLDILDSPLGAAPAGYLMLLLLS
jgi:phosphatidate cytidylyltransferase